jgi:pimeloyl-ACP methyl ester carboxylesterase
VIGTEIIPGSMNTKDNPDTPVIVLVHGAFADGSCWRHVIPLLQRDGYPVIAVQNPLTSFADDVTTTKRVIDAQTGSVVAVGHSYGGAVITAAAAGNPHVKALVYVAAFAPESGEKIKDLLDKYGPTPLSHALSPDAAGFLYIDRARFREVVAKDVSSAEARVMAATQKPIAGAAFGGSVDTPAWKTIPSWYLLAQEDLAIKPELQRFMAKRIGAHTAEIKSSHVPFISHPKEVVKLIEEAASAAAK